ncbi:hypothetical protein Tco_0158927 [Tanacetum coccineum]
MGKAIVKLVKKVKKMEDILKRRHVVFTDSEDEEPEDQGRIILDIDDDPLGSKGDFVTPTKPSGEAQEEEISPTTLEAAKTLSKVASQRSNTGFEEVNTGFEKVNTGGLGVSTGSGPVSSARGQKKESYSNDCEETQAPKRRRTQNKSTRRRLNVLEESCQKKTLSKRVAVCKSDKRSSLQKKELKQEEGTWKLTQLKKLSFEEEKIMDKSFRQRFFKKQRINDKDFIEEKVTEVKEEEPVIRTGKRKKQKARKGINVDKSPQGDSETDEEESVEAMNPTPLDTKSNIVANWKIFQQGRKKHLSDNKSKWR